MSQCSALWSVGSSVFYCFFSLGCCEFCCQYRCIWLPGKTHLQSDLLCVRCNTKLYSLSLSLTLIIQALLNVVGVTREHTVYGQHREWATLGFVRAIASNATICRCLIEKRWLHTLLTMINIPAAVALSSASADDVDDSDDHEQATAVHHLSLPKRVIVWQWITSVKGKWLCFYLCVSVCLPVCYITQNIMNGFWWNFLEGWVWPLEQSFRFWSGSWFGSRVPGSESRSGSRNFLKDSLFTFAIPVDRQE